jgi:hypothetical protein
MCPLYLLHNEEDFCYAKITNTRNRSAWTCKVEVENIQWLHNNLKARCATTSSKEETEEGNVNVVRGLMDA